MESKQYSFSSLLECIVDNRGKTCPTSESGIPLIATNCIKNDGLYPVFERIRYVSKNTYDSWFRGHPIPEDIIFVCKGSPGKVSWTPNPVSFCIAQDMVAIRADKTKVYPKYLFALLRSQETQNKILNMHVGTLIPHFKKGDFSNLYFDIPIDYNLQKFIGNIYFLLSEKIELNRKMNETLEAMAQALFKSWFVDFDPVIDNALAAGHPIPEELQAKASTRQALGDKRQALPDNIRSLFPSEFEYSEELGWIPKGWEVKKLGDFVTVKRGGSPRPIHDYLVDDGLPWVKISDATSCTSRFLTGTKQFIKSEGLKKTVFLKKGALILSNSATPGLPILLDLDACIHDGWLYFPEKQLFSDLYLYQFFLVIRNDLLLQGNGSVFNNLKTDILKKHPTIIPNSKILDFFDIKINCIHEKIHNIETQNQALTKLRDTLLPKLLSGEIRIPDAEQLIKEASQTP